MNWFDLQFHGHGRKSIKKPHEYEKEIEPYLRNFDENIFTRAAGSMLGLAIADALGAHVEFRSREYLVRNQVIDLSSGGTWGLEKGQFTDDTSMALCLAISLITCEKFNLYDQLVRYKWWYRHGYMSSTGQCFDIGNATRRALEKFEQRQKQFCNTQRLSMGQMDSLTDRRLINQFDLYCSEHGAAGNGALMRLAPVPLFFFRDPPTAVEYSGQSGLITHGDRKAYDACRYYGALIVAALHDYSKDQLLDHQFYEKHVSWFGGKDLHPDIMQIAEGSYEKSGGYEDGIRGGGYIVKAMEAALWAFWSTTTFQEGALAAVNLGDDTDTTAAIYGQLAGAFYGYAELPKQWEEHIYAKNLILTLAKLITSDGERCMVKKTDYPMKSPIHPNALSPKQPVPNVQLELTSTCEDVCRWLEIVGKNAKSYINTFEIHDIDGYRVLHFVDRATLMKYLTWHNIIDHGTIYDAIRKKRRDLSIHKHMPDDAFYQRFAEDEYSKLFDEGAVAKGEKVKSNVEQWIHQFVHRELSSDTIVDRVEILQNRDRYTRFLQQIESAEYKQTQSDFQLNWQVESNVDKRLEVIERLKNLSNEVKRNTKINVARLWYGCSRTEIKQLMKENDIMLKKREKGWFGNGIYLTSTVKDAIISTGSNECLIMCYAILLNPFPVIADDGNHDVPPEKFRFYNHEHHDRHHCHYIPVSSVNPQSSLDARPPRDGIESVTFDEVVMFHQNDILPFAIIYLTPKTHSSSIVSVAESTEGSTNC